MTTPLLDSYRLEFALENLGAILWEWVPETDTVVVYPSTASFFDSQLSSFAELLELMHPDDRERVTETVEASLETGESFDLEFRTKNADEVRVFETRGSVHREPEAEAPRIVGISTEITERKRRETEFQTIVEQSSDVITVVDSEGVIEYASPAARRVFGYEADELIGTAITNLIHPLDRDAATAAFLEAKTTGEEEPERVEYRLRHGAGTVRWVESRVTPRGDVTDPQFVINTHDITARMEAQQALKHTDESRSLALEASGAGIWDWEIETDRINWHASCERLFRVPEGTFEGTYEAFARRVHEDDLPAVEEAINRTINHDEPFNIDYRIIRDDGVERWISARGKLLSDSSGNPTRLLGVGIDITEQKERERELEQYERIVETASDPIYALDEIGRFTLVNEALATAIECSKEELVGSNIVDQLEPAAVEASLNHIMALASGESDLPPLELSLSTPEGMRDYEVNITLNGDAKEDSAPTTVGVARDVTDVKEHERRLSVMDRVLRHNIRNKLNLILAHASSLTTRSDQEVQQHAEGILEAGAALSSLSESARRFKTSTHPNRSGVQVTNITDCVTHVVDEARLQFPDATVRLRQTEAWGEVHEAFELALTELVENAVQHSDRAVPTVEVSVEEHESMVSVQVRDDGPGLSDMERDVILKGKESPLEHGLGLGLWLVRWTVDNSGGSIDVRNNDPSGTVVEIQVPRKPQDEPN